MGTRRKSLKLACELIQEANTAFEKGSPKKEVERLKASIYGYNSQLEGLAERLGQLPKSVSPKPLFTQVEVEFIEPGKPIQNAFIESFNGRFRDECLNDHAFMSIDHTCFIIEKWRKEYNEERPHSGIGMKIPKQFALEMQSMLPAASLTSQAF